MYLKDAQKTINGEICLIFLNPPVLFAIQVVFIRKAFVAHKAPLNP